MAEASGPSRTRRVVFDAVALANVVVMVVNEFVRFPTGGTPFRLYTLALVVAFLGVWFLMRRFEYPVWATVAFQLTILGHTAGRFIIVDGAPLYRAVIVGIPADKLIHAFNTAAGTIFIVALLDQLDLPFRGGRGAFLAVMIASGMGAVVEIVEYVGALVLPTTAVGDYANNMQDLIANMIGAVAGWAIGAAVLGRAVEAPVDLSRPEFTRKDVDYLA